MNRRANLSIILIVAALAACNGTEPAIEATPADTAVTSGNHLSGNPSLGYGIQPHITAVAGPVYEGASGNTWLVVDLDLSPRTARPVTVDYMTSDGSAKAGADYRRAKGQVTFKPGITAATVEIAIINDDIRESEESFLLLLHASDYVTVDTPTVMLTILDND